MTDGFGDGRTKGRVFNRTGRNGQEDRITPYKAPHVPGLVTHVPKLPKSGWQTQALCGQNQARDYWFPRDVEGTSESKQSRIRAHYRAKAREICGVCPVKAQCNQLAEATKPQEGIWAGREWTTDGPAAYDPIELF